MKNKCTIDIRYSSKSEDVIEQSKSDKMISKNEAWENKMKAKGFAYVQVLGEIIPTYVFASPDRQIGIAEKNTAYKKHVKELREELKKQSKQ